MVLSKGHGVMALYACFYELGWLKDNDIKNYFHDRTILKGLSDAHVPGLEVTSGSLGHGLSVGVGLALGAQLKKTGQTVYAIVGDGEMNEGSMWEALLFASQWKLNNLVVVVDLNGFQAMGTTTEVMNLESLHKKIESFGFETYSVDGHSESALNDVFSKIKKSSAVCPKAVIAKTVKGKGISFMENDNTWHYTRLSDKTYSDAIEELKL
jgi:transketolase